MIAMPRVKVCCISSVEEASIAVRHGASALGLVSRMPSGPGVISDELIADIVATVPSPVATFLLTSLNDADAIEHQYAICRSSTLQLVDFVEPSELVKLRRKLPHVKLVQVVHVMGKAAISEAKRICPLVDALLLDSGNPNLPVKELGGTGRTHNWVISRRIRDQVDRPIFLAGGLRASNVAEAIRVVEPFGLDLCSSIRSDGGLSSDKLGEFMRTVRASRAGPEGKEDQFKSPG